MTNPTKIHFLTQKEGSGSSFKNGSKIRYLFNKIRLYNYLNSMIDVAIIFTLITAYEFEFDPTKNTTSRDILYIFLTVYTLVGFITNWFSGNLYRDFEIEIKGALAKTKSSGSEKFFGVFGKICKLY